MTIVYTNDQNISGEHSIIKFTILRGFEAGHSEITKIKKWQLFKKMKILNYPVMITSVYVRSSHCTIYQWKIERELKAYQAKD